MRTKRFAERWLRRVPVYGLGLIGAVLLLAGAAMVGLCCSSSSYVRKCTTRALERG